MCHQSQDCGERPRLPTAIQDRCITCHMPARDKIQVYFDTADDAYVPPVKAYQHRIAVDMIATQSLLRVWHLEQKGEDHQRIAEQLSKDLFEHWLAEARQKRNDYRHLAAIDSYRQALKIEADPAVQMELKRILDEKITIDRNLMDAARQVRQQKYTEAATTLEETLRLNPNLATAHGKLGTVYATLGQRDRAVTHLNAVRQHDPDDAYGEVMLGWLEYLDGQYQSASEHYRIADEVEPYRAKLHYQWGLALMKSESWADAATHFRTAIKIDPRHVQACVSLSQVLLHENQIAGAVELARRAASLTERKQSDVLLHLAECLAENKQLNEAAKAAEEALEIARQNRNDQVPRIQRRLREFQKR